MIAPLTEKQLDRLAECVAFSDLCNAVAAMLAEAHDTAYAKALRDAVAVTDQAVAEAWDEGYNAGLDDFAGDVKQSPNPYRAPLADPEGAQ